MKTAKVFKHGNSQAVRLPKEFRFDDDEVLIKRSAGGVLLLPRKITYPIGPPPVLHPLKIGYCAP